MSRFYFVLIICILMCSCIFIKQKAYNPGNTPSAMPFYIKKQEACIDIKESKGSLVLGLSVSKKGTIKYFNILQLRIVKENKDTLVNYAKMQYEPLSYDDYPSTVKLYYTNINEFVNTLALKPKKDVHIEDENFIYMNVKIGCK